MLDEVPSIFYPESNNIPSTHQVDVSGTSLRSILYQLMNLAEQEDLGSIQHGEYIAIFIVRDLHQCAIEFIRLTNNALPFQLCNIMVEIEWYDNGKLVVVLMRHKCRSNIPCEGSTTVDKPEMKCTCHELKRRTLVDTTLC